MRWIILSIKVSTTVPRLFGILVQILIATVCYPPINHFQTGFFKFTAKKIALSVSDYCPLGLNDVSVYIKQSNSCGGPGDFMDRTQ